jgi:hypothetical protein
LGEGCHATRGCNCRNEIQKLDSHARTISTELPAEQASTMRKTALEIEAESEAESRKAIRAGHATATDYRNVANALVGRDELAEAERYARAAVAADEQSPQMLCPRSHRIFQFHARPFSAMQDRLLTGWF